MSKHFLRLWIVALVLGWAFNLLFWGRSTGANFPIFVGLCLTGGLGLLIYAGFKPARKSLFLLIPAVFFSVVSYARQEPLTHALAFVGTLASLGLFAISYSDGRWLRYSLLDYIYQYFMLAISVPAVPIHLARQVRAEREEQGIARPKFPVKPVLRGFAIALPVILIFTSLLGSADAVFDYEVRQLLFGGQFIYYLLQLGVICLVAYLLVGVLLHAATRKPEEKLIGEDKPVLEPFLGFIETTIVLASVSALLLLFVFVQFRYFFGGEVNIGMTGFTYSEYARRGFNELMLVALMSLLMVLGFGTISHRETERQRRIFSGLSAALLSLVLVILVSAYQRLWLAIDWHGFSRLRLYPLVFMVWLGALFVVVVGLEILHRERHIATAVLLACFGFAASLAFVNVDASTVKVNVARAEQGKYFNVTHLAGLSLDAVPTLVEAFQDPSLSAKTRDGVGAALACFRYQIDRLDNGTQDWRTWDLYEYRARLAMNQVYYDKLPDFGTNDSQWPVRVFTPAGAIYLCDEER